MVFEGAEKGDAVGHEPIVPRVLSPKKNRDLTQLTFDGHASRHIPTLPSASRTDSAETWPNALSAGRVGARPNPAARAGLAVEVRDNFFRLNQ